SQRSTANRHCRIPAFGGPQPGQCGQRADIADDQSASPQSQGRQINFGPDGCLYIAMGDGGVSSNGQSRQTLLGKILRIGVDPPFSAGLQYQIPADNPFVGGGGLAEIWACGFAIPGDFLLNAAGPGSSAVKSGRAILRKSIWCRRA